MGASEYNSVIKISASRCFFLTSHFDVGSVRPAIQTTNKTNPRRVFSQLNSNEGAERPIAVLFLSERSELKNNIPQDKRFSN